MRKGSGILKSKLTMPSGGKRKGAGNKPLYNEPTKRIQIIVPISKEKEIKEKIKGILKEYITKGK